MKLGWLPLVLLMAVGCTQAQSVANTSGSSQEGPPKYGGMFSYHTTETYSNLDPTTGLRGEISENTIKMFNGLLKFKYGPELNYADVIVEPGVADRWDISSDAKVFTFHLRQGVKFANTAPVNGREVTSKDVKFSFEYISRTGEFQGIKARGANHFNFKLEGLDRIETPDPSTVVVRFKDSFAPFLIYAATPELPILPREIYDRDGHFSDQAIGTGPWQVDLVSSQSGSRMVFKKNPTYWDEGKPYIDEIRVLTVSDGAPASAAFQTKQLDILYSLTNLTDADSVRKSVTGVMENTFLGWNANRVYYNVSKPPFNDPKFRKAFGLAIDRDEFVRLFTGGKGKWAAAGGPPGLFTDEELKNLLPRDIEQGKRILAEAGYPPGFQIEYLHSEDYGPENTNDAVLLQSQLKKVGIDMQIKNVDRTTVSNNRRNGNYTIAATGAGPGLEPDVDYLVFSYFHPSSGANYYHVNDAGLTPLVEATRREGDPAKRRELVRTAARYINENVLGMWTYFAPGYNFWHTHVKGYSPNQAYSYRPVPSVWLDK